MTRHLYRLAVAPRRKVLVSGVALTLTILLGWAWWPALEGVPVLV